MKNTIKNPQGDYDVISLFTTTIFLQHYTRFHIIFSTSCLFTSVVLN